MELNDKLYKKLFNLAKWKIKDEDYAAEAVTSIFMKIHTYTGTTDQNFNTWSTTIINNKAKDYWRKQKKEKQLLIQSEEAHNIFFESLEDTINTNTFFIDKVKSILSEEDLEFMLNYCESKELKTGAEKLRFYHLKQKVNKEKKAPSYILRNINTGQIFKSNTFKDMAVHLNITSEAIRQAYNEKRIICKEWKISDTN